jgi:hypothetical protein
METKRKQKTIVSGNNRCPLGKYYYPYPGPTKWVVRYVPGSGRWTAEFVSGTDQQAPISFEELESLKKEINGY